MTETIDFLKCISQASDETLSRKEIVTILKDLFLKDEEAVWGCVDHYDKLGNDLDLFKKIISCADNSARCESLITDLNEEQLKDFSKIVLALKDVVELDDFTKIRDATFCLKTPTESSIEKVSILLEMNSKIQDKDFDKTIAGIVKFYFEMKNLADFYGNYRRKKSDKEWINNLSRLPEEDLDSLISLSKLTIENLDS